MRFRVAAALCAGLLASSALAQSDQGGVLQYPAAFFADARPNTAYDMIARLPGFTFDDGKSARGFAGTAGNVLIDGQRPTAKTDDLQSILQRIPASDVERIEVIRGGAQGIDMHGQTVVANVVRKKSDSTQIVADVSNNFWPDGHMVPSASIQFTRHDGDSTYEASLSQIGNFDDSVGKGFYDITDPSTGAITRNNLHYKGMGIGWGSTAAATVPLLGGQFKANVTYQDSPFYSANHFFGAAGPDWQITDSNGSKKGEIGLHWIGTVGGIELETLALQRLGRSTDYQVSTAAGDNEVFWQRNRTAESIARATLRYRPDADLTLEGGAEGAYNLLDGSSTYSVNGTAVPLPSANARVDEKRTEAFAQATWNFAPDWKLEAGARFEYSVISESGYTSMSREFFYPKPRALIAWSPAKDTQIRLRYERVLGQLDFTNFIASSNLTTFGVNAGNPNLAPDRHSQYELSLEQHFWERGAVVVTLLHEEISGVLDYIPVTGSSGVFDAPGNIGNGHNNQFDVELTLPLDRIGLKNGLLKSTTIWRLTGVRDPATGTVREISSIRPRDFEFTLTQDIDSLKSTWGVFLFTGWDEEYFRPLEFRHRKVIPPYIELNWDYKPTPQWMFSVAVKNAGRFGYDDVNSSFTGLRGSVPPAEISEFKLKSQARLYLEIRRTF
jgi:outer membrane receptor protein involved in Fe transport